MDWQGLFLRGEGRIGRKDFWIGVLILFAIWVMSHALHLLAPLVWVLLLYPWVCVFAKRLHDFGRSGWLIAVPFAIGAAALVLALVFGGMSAMGAIFAAATGGAEPTSWGMVFGGLGLMLAMLGVAGLVKLVFILWVGLTPGDPGPNRYGPPVVTGAAVAPPTP